MSAKSNGATLHHDLYRTGPGIIAGRYMRMFWHPIYAADQLKATWAKPIRIMSEDFTLLVDGGVSCRLRLWRNRPGANANIHRHLGHP